MLDMLIEVVLWLGGDALANRIARKYQDPVRARRAYRRFFFVMLLFTITAAYIGYRVYVGFIQTNLKG